MSSLQLYWTEAKPEETLGVLWGQLAGGLHRLQFVLDEIDTLRSKPIKDNIESAVKRLEYHLINYIIRIYEIRERIINLISGISGQSKLRNLLRSKDQTKRKEAYEKIAKQHPFLSAQVKDTLEIMESDIELRNMHTHEAFLSLGLFTNDDVYDPLDVLMEQTDADNDKKQLEEFLWTEIFNVCEEYYEKGEKIREFAYNILKDCIISYESDGSFVCRAR